MRWMHWAIVASLVAACGGDTSGPGNGTGGDGGTPPAPPLPANLTVVQARDDFGTFGHEVVVVHLKNTGGPGTYRIEAWGSRPNGEDQLFGATDPVDVPRYYEETPWWDFYTGSLPIGAKYIQWILVFSRDQGSTEYRQTARFDFPP